MKDGIINLDTKRGKEFGFTSDKYNGYIWKQGNFIVMSVIGCNVQNKGLLRELFSTIQRKGYGIKVPNPFPRMEAICKHYGFTETTELFEDRSEHIPVYVKSVSPKATQKEKTT